MRNIFIQGFLYFSQFIKGLVTVPGTRRHSREELLHAPAGMIHLLATEKFSTTKKKKTNKNNKKPVQGNTDPKEDSGERLLREPFKGILSS